MVFRPTECQHLKIRVVIGQAALLVCCQMASNSRRKIFRGVFSLFRPTTTAFLRRLVFLLHDRSLICKFSVEKGVAGSLNTNQPFWCCRTLFFTLIPAGRRYACFVPLCFRVFHLDNHGSWGHQRRFCVYSITLVCLSALKQSWWVLIHLTNASLGWFGKTSTSIFTI